MVNFFQFFSRFWNFGAFFIVKQRFLEQTFLKSGWLEIAHIRSTCGPDLPRASRALRMDAHFRQGLPRKKVRCADGAETETAKGEREEGSHSGEQQQ